MGILLEGPSKAAPSYRIGASFGAVLLPGSREGWLRQCRRPWSPFVWASGASIWCLFGKGIGGGQGRHQVQASGASPTIGACFGGWWAPQPALKDSPLSASPVIGACFGGWWGCIRRWSVVWS